MHLLSQWNPQSSAVEMDAMTSAVVVCKMRCMFFCTVKTFLCALSERSIRSFFSLPACLFLWRPLVFCMHALPSQTVFNFLSQRHQKLRHFISDIIDFLGWRRPATNQSA